MSEVKIEFTGAVNDALAAVDKVEKTGVGAADKVKSAFEVLKIQSSADMDEAKNRINAAYEQIKNSGLATADEITRAEAARAKAIEKIDTDNLASRKSITDQFKEHWLAVTAAMTAAYMAAQQAMDYVKLAASAQQAGQSFDIVAKSWGVDGDKLLSKMKEVSRGMMTEADLQQQAVKMMQQGMSFDQIVGTLNVAVGAARTAGVDLKTAFEQIGTAEADLMVRGLKHMGIVIDQTKAIKDYAEKNNILVDSMTEEQKTQAITTAVLETAGNKLDALGKLTGNASDNIQRHTASWEELKTMLGGGIMAVIMGVQAGFYLLAAAAVEAYAYTLKLSAALLNLVPGDWAKQKVQDLNNEFKIANKTVDALGQTAHEMWNEAKDQAYAAQNAAEKEAEAKAKLAIATAKAKDQQAALNKTANDKAMSLFIDEWEKKITEMDPLLDEYTKKLISFQAEMAKLKEEKGDVKDKSGNSIIDSLTQQGLDSLNKAQAIAYQDLMNNRLAPLQQELAKELKEYEKNVRDFGDTDQKRADILELHRRNEFDITAKFAKEDLDKQKTTLEQLKTYYQACYDFAIAKVKEYSDISNAAAKTSSTITNFLNQYNATPKSPAEQMEADKRAVLNEMKDAGQSWSQAAIDGAAKAGMDFLTKYKGYVDNLGFTQDFKNVQDALKELRWQSDAIKADVDQGKGYWGAYAQNAVANLDPINQALLDIQTKAQTIDWILQQEHTLKLSTAEAENALAKIGVNLDGLLAKMGKLGGGRSNSSSGPDVSNAQVGDTVFLSDGAYEVMGNVQMPGAATGGYFTKPTVIAIAENEPEYAIPASKMNQMQSGGSNITIAEGAIVINANGVNDPVALAKMVAKPVRDELMRLQYLSSKGMN